MATRHHARRTRLALAASFLRAPDMTNDERVRRIQAEIQAVQADEERQAAARWQAALEARSPLNRIPKDAADAELLRIERLNYEMWRQGWAREYYVLRTLGCDLTRVKELVDRGSLYVTIVEGMNYYNRQDLDHIKQNATPRMIEREEQDEG